MKELVKKYFIENINNIPRDKLKRIYYLDLVKGDTKREKNIFTIKFLNSYRKKVNEYLNKKVTTKEKIGKYFKNITKNLKINEYITISILIIDYLSLSLNKQEFKDFISHLKVIQKKFPDNEENYFVCDIITLIYNLNKKELKKLNYHIFRYFSKKLKNTSIFPNFDMFINFDTYIKENKNNLKSETLNKLNCFFVNPDMYYKFLI